MNPPAIAAYRLLCAVLLGVGLGVFYGFLRPLRTRHRHIADLMFLLALYPTWVYFAFGIAGGDLRFGYTAGLFAGILAWESTFGRWLRPVFAGFWRLIYRIFRVLALPFQKFFKKNCKNRKISLCNRQKVGYNKVE